MSHIVFLANAKCERFTAGLYEAQRSVQRYHSPLLTIFQDVRTHQNPYINDNVTLL